MADEDAAVVECPKCEDCPPAGAPAWMATFSDLVTLLMTFFVLLYATSKQDDHKFEAVAGSIRKAFAGNSKNIGEVIQLGKSPDDAPTMIESQEPVEPFPIDFKTDEGMLDKIQINRESDEDLVEMKKLVTDYKLEESVNIYEMPEGVKIKMKDKIVFKKNTFKMSGPRDVLERMIKLLRDEKWIVVVEGHSAKGETARGMDAYDISARRAHEVSKMLRKSGVPAERITTSFYGDSRPVKNEPNSRVEFILRVRDPRAEGHKVRPY